jgi:two-component system, OmpR family, sensor histidine kinase KdpD
VVIRRHLVAALGSFAAVAAVTGAVFALRSVAPVLSLGVLYVFAVVFVALVWGFAYALPASIASMLALNWFFLPPTHTLRLHQSENWFALAVYLGTSIVVSSLTSAVRRRAAEAEQRGLEQTLLADVSAALLQGGEVQGRLRPASARLADALHVGRARIELDSFRRPEPGEASIPLTAGERRVGTLFFDKGASLDAEAAQRLLPALASLLAVAADRERLSRTAVEAETLRRSDVMKTTLLRAVSHDLRSPLTAIRVAADGLSNETLDLGVADRNDLLATIRVEASRLERLVSNLLDISRLEAGGATPRPELWAVDGLVSLALEAVPESERVHVEMDEATPPVRVDPAHIERVLANVIENALAATPPGRRVVVATQVDGDELWIRVDDEGPGLEPDALDRIFEPFERGGERAYGSGLGLAIARGFAEANGGRLWAEASPLGGAAFVLALPAAATVRAPS